MKKQLTITAQRCIIAMLWLLLLQLVLKRWLQFGKYFISLRQ
jgi:hypothetical protein